MNKAYCKFGNFCSLRKPQEITYLLIIIIMITEYSHQVVLVRNPVVNVLVPVVQQVCYFAVVWHVIMLMTTAEAKPRNIYKHHLYLQRREHSTLYWARVNIRVI